MVSVEQAIDIVAMLRDLETEHNLIRRTSTVAKVKKERIVLERVTGPRSEARKEEKGKRKVAEVRPEIA